MCFFFTDYYSTILETEETRSPLKPTEVHDVHFIHLKVIERIQGVALGKWMIFKHWDELDATWERVRTAVLRNELEGCSSASSCTMRYNPSITGPGPHLAGVICVYTQEHDMDAIGFKLIEMVEQDIRYKTDQDTIDYKYSFNSSTPVSIKTIYWNNGRPSSECEDKPLSSTWLKREDFWCLNVVEAPKSLNFGEVEGRWVLYPEYKKLTGLWHTLKRLVESEKENFGVTKMICPPKRKRKCAMERPEFHVHTSKERKRSVGQKLIRMMEDDILYQYKPQEYSDPPFCDRTDGSQHPDRESGESGYSSGHQPGYRGLNWESSVRGHGRFHQQGCRGPGGGNRVMGYGKGWYRGPDVGSREEILYWNDGEPDYEIVRRKGITKNWRTGEDIS